MRIIGTCFWLLANKLQNYKLKTKQNCFYFGFHVTCFELNFCNVGIKLPLIIWIPNLVFPSLSLLTPKPIYDTF